MSFCGEKQLCLGLRYDCKDEASALCNVLGYNHGQRGKNNVSLANRFLQKSIVFCQQN